MVSDDLVRISAAFAFSIGAFFLTRLLLLRVALPILKRRRPTWATPVESSRLPSLSVLIVTFPSLAQTWQQIGSGALSADPILVGDVARHPTNLGLYRIYLTKYLQRHPRVNQEMLWMVRQLQVLYLPRFPNTGYDRFSGRQFCSSLILPTARSKPARTPSRKK